MLYLRQSMNVTLNGLELKVVTYTKNVIREVTILTRILSLTALRFGTEILKTSLS